MKRSDLVRAAGGLLIVGGAAAVVMQARPDDSSTMSRSSTSPITTCESPDMQIRFTRSGGFAGMTLSTTVETDTLAAEEERQVCELVEDAGFFELPERVVATGSAGADRFEYEIAVEDEEEGTSHTVTVGEASVPETLQPLIDWLERAARRGL